MKFSNKTYDTLKIVALIVAPVATFIGAVCIIWGVPFSEQITATLAALDALIGSLLKISNANYNKPEEMDVSGLEYLEEGEGDE